MNSRRRTILIAALFLLLQPLANAGVRGQQPSAASAVNSFYRFHLSHNMDFSARNIQLRRRWLTPEFYQLLLNRIKRQAAYNKAHSDEVPIMMAIRSPIHKSIPIHFESVSRCWTENEQGSQWLFSGPLEQAGDETSGIFSSKRCKAHQVG